MATILQCSDPSGRTVVLDESRWNDHILIQHPELDGYLQAIESTLTGPHVITLDARWEQGENYYRASALPAPYTRLYLKVCVHFDRDSFRTGRVITAYLTDRIKSSEVRKWSNPTS